MIGEKRTSEIRTVGSHAQVVACEKKGFVFCQDCARQAEDDEGLCSSQCERALIASELAEIERIMDRFLPEQTLPSKKEAQDLSKRAVACVRNIRKAQAIINSRSGEPLPQTKCEGVF